MLIWKVLRCFWLTFFNRGGVGEVHFGGIVLIVKECTGYELQKEKSNTSEDFFNRSEVTFIEEGKEHTLYVLYVRYFEESFEQYVPYSSNPLFHVEGRDVYLKDIVALICLLNHPDNKRRKRIYMSDHSVFVDYLKQADFIEVEKVFSKLQK